MNENRSRTTVNQIVWNIYRDEPAYFQKGLVCSLSLLRGTTKLDSHVTLPGSVRVSIIVINRKAQHL